MAAKIEIGLNADNLVWLREWWLIKVRDEFNKERLGVGGITTPGKRTRIFRSAPIVKRIDTFNVETKDGISIRIQGLINVSRMEENGFPSEACNNFRIGFPYDWENYNHKYFHENDNESLQTRTSAPVDCSSNLPDSFSEFPKNKILECLELLIKKINAGGIGTNDAEKNTERDACTSSNTDPTVPPVDRDMNTKGKHYSTENVSSPVENLKKSSEKSPEGVGTQIAEENTNNLSGENPGVVPPTSTPNQGENSTQERPNFNECTPISGFTVVHTSTKRNVGCQTSATRDDPEVLNAEDDNDDRATSKSRDRSNPSPADSLPAQIGVQLEDSSREGKRHQEAEKSNATSSDKGKVIDSLRKTPKKKLSFADEAVAMNKERIFSPPATEPQASSQMTAEKGADLNTVSPNAGTSDPVGGASLDKVNQPTGSRQVLQPRIGRQKKRNKLMEVSSDSSSSVSQKGDNNYPPFRGKSVLSKKGLDNEERDDPSGPVLRPRRENTPNITKILTSDRTEMDRDDSSSFGGKDLDSDKKSIKERSGTDVPSVLGKAPALSNLFSRAKGRADLQSRKGLLKVDVFSFSEESDVGSSVDPAKGLDKSMSKGKNVGDDVPESRNASDLKLIKKTLAASRTPKSSEKKPASASKVEVKAPLPNLENGSLSFASPELLNLKRTKSGRVIVPKLSNWCQQILYQDGLIAGILTGVDAISSSHPRSRPEPSKKRKKFL